VPTFGPRMVCTRCGITADIEREIDAFAAEPNGALLVSCVDPPYGFV
jgi:hypothetical protein